MSVESEILRIQRNIADTYAAVSEKGGEVPLQPTSANLAAAVSSIPSGSELTAGDGLTIVDGVASVTTPVRSIVTQAEFDALPEAQQNKGMYVVTEDGDGSGGGSSSGEIYSTEEARIGTWIDGKPLYRRVLTGTVTNANNGRVFTFTDGIHPVRVSACVYYGTGNKTATPLPYVYENGEYGLIFVDSGVNVFISVSDSVLIGKQFSAILEYTKFSD